MAVPCHESDLPDVKIVKIGYELSQRTEDLRITRNEILVFFLSNCFFFQIRVLRGGDAVTTGSGEVT